MRTFINQHKPYWYIAYKRRKFLHGRLMQRLDALTDVTLLDRILADA